MELAERYGSSVGRSDLIAMFSRLKVVEAVEEKKGIFLQQLWELLLPQVQHCIPRQLAEVMLTCTRLGAVAPDKPYSICLSTLISQVDDGKPRDLSNAIYAVAMAASPSVHAQCWPIVEQHVLPAFIGSRDDMNAHDISNVL